MTRTRGRHRIRRTAVHGRGARPTLGAPTSRTCPLGPASSFSPWSSCVESTRHRLGDGYSSPYGPRPGCAGITSARSATDREETLDTAGRDEREASFDKPLQRDRRSTLGVLCRYPLGAGAVTISQAVHPPPNRVNFTTMDLLRLEHADHGLHQRVVVRPTPCCRPTARCPLGPSAPCTESTGIARPCFSCLSHRSRTMPIRALVERSFGVGHDRPCPGAITPPRNYPGSCPRREPKRAKATDEKSANSRGVVCGS